MKKIIALIISLAVVVSMAAACGDSSSRETTAATGDAPVQTQADTSGSDSAEPIGYTFTYKGVKLYMDMDAEEAVEALKDYQKGEPNTTASCAFEGLDYEYFYGSFYMCTGTLNGRDLVDNILFMDDTISTDEGLSIGDSKEKVEELYGADGFNGINAYQYKEEPCWLTIIMDSTGETVESIMYGYKN